MSKSRISIAEASAILGLSKDDIESWGPTLLGLSVRGHGVNRKLLLDEVLHAKLILAGKRRWKTREREKGAKNAKK